MKNSVNRSGIIIVSSTNTLPGTIINKLSSVGINDVTIVKADEAIKTTLHKGPKPMLFTVTEIMMSPRFVKLKEDRRTRRLNERKRKNK